MMPLASLHDIFGDLVIYRDLDPIDCRLPRFAESHLGMGIPGPVRPRKLEPAYAQAMAWLLHRARALDAPDVELAELVYLGDTALNDGLAFRNLRETSGWRGWAFIGSERNGDLLVSKLDGVYSANRWTALADFISWLLDQGAALDARTAVVVDVDKTALGARGRNDASIDRARMAALEATMAAALGPAFNEPEFRRAYAEINTPKYHTFTVDNQDNVAYVCLVLGTGVYTLEGVRGALETGTLGTFREFIEQVDGARDRLSPAFRALHSDVLSRVRAGDPTPFKEFRQRECRETVGRMGYLPDQAPLAQRLAEEICLTREVVEVAHWLRARGCLLIALSDKPDEATNPSPELAAEGFLPLHRTTTHTVGQSIAGLLPNVGDDQ